MDEYTLETFTHNGYTVKIIADQDARSPREDDNVGKMVCWHRGYNLGDEQRRDDVSDFMMELAEEFRPGLNDWLGNDLWSQMVKADYESNRSLYEAQKKAYYRRCHEITQRVIDAHYIMLPLGLYDHSGISMYIGSGPHATDGGGWDSGQVGWIYCTKKKAIEE